jgi:hypothetical protein
MAQLLGRLPQLAAVLGDANMQAYLAAGPGDTLARQQVHIDFILFLINA